MDILEHRYYRINRHLLHAVGQWPYQPRKQRQIQWIVLYLTIGSVILVQGFKLAQIWGDMTIMVECLVPMGVQILALMKSSNCISNDVKMKRLMDQMKEYWNELTDEVEMEILLRYIEHGSIMSSIYACSVFGSMTIYLLIPIIPQILDIILPLNETRQRRFLYQIEYYVNEDDYYVSIMIHIYVGTILCIMIIAGADSMLLAYVHYVCGMFTIIGHRLKNIMKDSDLDMIDDSETDDDKVYRQITNCLRDHMIVVELCHLIESSHTLTLLFQIGSSMLMISATGLHLVTKLETYNEAYRLGQFLVGQLSHLFFNSLPGQMLIDHTEQFRNSLYFSEWYRFPMRGRHILRLAMVRSLKPCKMTAGKIYDMSIESFVKVMQTSMSYFMVLLSMQ